MNTSLRFSFLCLVSVLAAGPIHATAGELALGQTEKLLFEDDFDRGELAPKWKPGKGSWSVKGGVVHAEEIPADKHGAYAYVTPRFEYKDIVAEFSFKLDGAKNLHFMMEDSSYKGAHAGHIIRASITPNSVVLADSKFGSMNNEIYEKNQDPKTTPEEKKAIAARIKDKTATFKIQLDLAQWHKARVEVVGDEMVISIDGKPAGYLKSDGVAHKTKNMVGFTVGGTSAQIDNLKIWDAMANVGWAGNRAEVIAGMLKN